MGLESINKASAAAQSVQTAASVTTNVQAAGSSTQTADYTAAQTAQAVQLPFGQDSASPESQESKATLADVKDISKVLNSNTVAEFGVYPSEKMLKMFTKACELAGLLVDEKM